MMSDGVEERDNGVCGGTAEAKPTATSRAMEDFMVLGGKNGWKGSDAFPTGKDGANWLDEGKWWEGIVVVLVLKVRLLMEMAMELEPKGKLMPEATGINRLD